VRRGPINGIATSQEVEAMIRQKLGGLGDVIDQAPIKAGFVGHGHTQGARSLVLRVTNVVDAVVSGIDVLVDLQHIGLPQLTARQRPLTNVTLQPGESREVQVSIANPQFYVRYLEMSDPATIRISGATMWGRHIGDYWLNALLRVYYRDEDGFIHELRQELAIDA
jgi:hypothetical protein